MKAADFAALSAVGLNLHAVMELADLPAELAAPLRAQFDPERRFRQLILVGNAGPQLWREVEQAGEAAADPIDAFSVRALEHWLALHCAGRAYRIVYPGSDRIGLQALGALAGWHHPAPFKVGIMAGWGSWFGYRVALLADSGFAPTAALQAPSPCSSCETRPCIRACPAGAMDGAAADGGFELQACLAYRRRPDSRCRATCVARLACPVGREHRYDEAQIRHAYLRSLAAIGAG